jgi:hypothetical protein
MEEGRCKKMVLGEGKWGEFHKHQCTRKAVRDGFCNVHHPESVKLRDEKAYKHWRDRFELSPQRLLEKAKARIEELEKEITRLRAEKGEK